MSTFISTLAILTLWIDWRLQGAETWLRSAIQMAPRVSEESRGAVAGRLRG